MHAVQAESEESMKEPNIVSLRGSDDTLKPPADISTFLSIHSIQMKTGFPCLPCVSDSLVSYYLEEKKEKNVRLRLTFL